MKLKKLNKKALYCMYAATAFSTIIAISILTISGLYFSLFSQPFLKIVYFVILALSLINLFISPFFRYRRYRYSIDDECIYIREGYIFITENIVPLERLHKLDMAQGPIDRFFGLTKVTVTTAGGDATICFLERETALSIADSLKRKINTIAQEENHDEQ